MSIPIEDNDQTRARREHLERIREIVGNAYPNKFDRTNVAGNPEGADTVSALANHDTIKRIIGDDAFAAAFDALAHKVAGGERPAPEELAAVNEKLNTVTVRVAGRLAVPPRVMGKAAFVHLSDGKARLQIYVRRDDVREMLSGDSSATTTTLDGWELFGLLDHGDFIGVEGYLFVTKTGELSVHVRSFRFLTKAMLPMPDKLHGISDPEIRQRQRYADLIAGSLKVEHEPGELTPREVFERRSKVITEMRRYLDDHGYIEVETPILSPLASGAAARPFKTRHNALSIDLYARIAPELYLKRLLVGGFERVYELNRNFRNEGIDRTHNPEFTMLEFYCAYMDVIGMMDFWEQMLRTVVQKVTGGTSVRYDEHEIDFGRPFRRLSMKDAILEYDAASASSDSGEAITREMLDDPQQAHSLASRMRDAAKGVAATTSPGEASKREQPVGGSKAPDEIQSGNDIAFIFEHVAEQHLIDPTFIIDFPKAVSPLSKASPDDPSVAERFELFIAGMEIANGFSELNDPAEQYRRFEEQTAQRERGNDEAMQMDTDYVRALAYGMPPAAGIGPGIDRIVMLLTNRRSIRDVILFPHMRPAERHAEETEAADAPPEEAG